jgi:hypothetical protein
MTLTVQRRASAINVALPVGRVYPIPDGDLSASSDRAHMALSYAMPAALPPPPPPPLGPSASFGAVELIDIALASPLPARQPLAALPIDPRVVSVVIRHGLPGYDTLTVGLAEQGDPEWAYRPLRESISAPAMADVTARIGGATVFEGYLQEDALPGNGFVAVGYQHTTGYGEIERRGNQQVSAEVVARAAIAAVPWLTAGTIVDPGTLYTWETFAGMSPAQALEVLCRAGGRPLGWDRDVPWMFRVRDGRVADFIPRVPATRPDYVIEYDPLVMRDLRRDHSEVIDGLRLLYTDREGTQRAIPTVGYLYQPGVDPDNTYLRRKVLTVSSDSAGQARQFALTYLEAHRAPRVTGTLHLSRGHGLRLPGGVEVPGHTLRAGLTLEIVGYGNAIITLVHADIMRGTTDIDLDPPGSRTLAGVLAQASETDVAYRGGVDATTGVPKRRGGA